jgi:endo-1,4-beta-xylanase
VELEKGPYQSACSSQSAPLEAPLRELGSLVGVALTSRRLLDDDYTRVAAREFNYLTPENEMKWEALEPSPGNFRFQDADAIVTFAEEHEMLVKGHTLVWHSQLPSWVDALEGEVAVREAMQRHIELTIEHYEQEFPGRVGVWDVVNEALDTQDDQVVFRDSAFYRELGEGFVQEAFEMARQAAPDALLFYNDYGIESLNSKSDATYDLMLDLVEAGAPIDGIGFQMHTIVLDAGPSRQQFASNLQRFVDLGLLVTVSEMDVSLCFGFDEPEQAWREQRARYHRILSACLELEECHGVSLWGVGDNDSWLNSYRPCDDTRFEPWPLLFDGNYERKPAWAGAHDALSGCDEW